MTRLTGCRPITGTAPRRPVSFVAGRRGATRYTRHHMSTATTIPAEHERVLDLIEHFRSQFEEYITAHKTVLELKYVDPNGEQYCNDAPQAHLWFYESWANFARTKQDLAKALYKIKQETLMRRILQFFKDVEDVHRARLEREELRSALKRQGVWPAMDVELEEVSIQIQAGTFCLENRETPEQSNPPPVSKKERRTVRNCYPDIEGRVATYIRDRINQGATVLDIKQQEIADALRVKSRATIAKTGAWRKLKAEKRRAKLPGSSRRFVRAAENRNWDEVAREQT